MSTNRKIRKGTTHLVTWAYDIRGHARGEIVSQHRNYKAAERKAKQSDFWRVDWLSDWMEATR